MLKLRTSARIWLVVCATLFVGFSSVQCSSGPDVRPCVFGHDDKGCHYDPTGLPSPSPAPPPEGELPEKLGFKPRWMMDNWTCFSPDDTRTLVEWMKRHSNCNGG